MNTSLLAWSKHGPTGWLQVSLHEHQTRKFAQMDHTSLLVLVFGQHRTNLMKICLLLDETFADCVQSVLRAHVADVLS